MKILPLLEQSLDENDVVSKSDFRKLQMLGSHAYKVYTIPKRKAGKRVIAHPSVKLKECQRKLISILELYLPVHDSSYAYVKGRSIKDNALVHAKSDYLLKMDFYDFFNSITPPLLSKHLDRVGLTVDWYEQTKLNQLLFWNPSKKKHGKLILSVGAPSSPFISNTIMYSFDEKISEICKKNNINYSRYADDLTFSSNIKGILFHVPDVVKTTLNQEFQGRLVINDSKTIFSSKKHNRHVTGLTINNNGSISLGRKRKKYISSLVFEYINNRLNDDDFNHLAGLLSFGYNVEPMFIHRLSRKYKINVIDKILKGKGV
ncbi:retron St85 family RNA-directed DNA polymerase [Vibrio parahaemolyticus]|uniref:retron St85 family RNA-directed DNA polymerase n=1 Tax=Vibrio parahaemolyticus TaxID=670 RepID=UPI003B67320E